MHRCRSIYPPLGVPGHLPLKSSEALFLLRWYPSSQSEWHQRKLYPPSCNAQRRQSVWSQSLRRSGPPEGCDQPAGALWTIQYSIASPSASNARGYFDIKCENAPYSAALSTRRSSFQQAKSAIALQANDPELCAKSYEFAFSPTFEISVQMTLTLNSIRHEITAWISTWLSYMMTTTTAAQVPAAPPAMKASWPVKKSPASKCRSNM